MCVHVLAHMYTHTDLSLNAHVHMGPDILAHSNTVAHPHICRHEAAHVYTDGIHNHGHTFAYRTTFKDLKACTCLFAHSVHSRTGSPLLSMLNNHEFTGKPLVSSTTRLAQAPLPASSLPQPHDRQSCSCQPQCLSSASHPPGVPRSLINPLANWPPAP